MRKRKRKEPRVEARVSLVGFDFSQPHAVPDRTTDRRRRQPSSDIPEARPCRDSRRARWAHPNWRMLCTPRIPDGGTVVVSVHVDTGRRSRTAGRGGGAPHLLETGCLGSFREYSILRACCRSGGRKHFASSGLGDPSGVGAELSGAGERALRRPSASGRIFLPPRRRKRDGHAVDRPRRIPDTRRCYVLSTLVLIFRYMSRSIMISSISSSDQLNFIERLESVNRVFRPA